MAQISPRVRIALLFGLSVLSVLATRLPLMPHYLYSFDTVNMALAFDEFDPSRNQPQPPGYPFFVAEARLVRLVATTPEGAFTVIKILICGLSVALLYLLGRRMFSAFVGAAAAVLLFVNPVFWYSGLTSPLRPHLALVSILVAYCCWRSLSGESRYFYAASIALGLGGGFRPALSVLLLPLWAMTAWKTRQPRVMLRGLVLLIVGTLTWVGTLAVLYGGLGRMIISFVQYLSDQGGGSSILLGASESGWRRMAGRAFIWTGSGALAWLWAVPLGWLELRKSSDGRWRLKFLAVLFLPPFLFQVFVHVGNPDHTLDIIPVLCLVGAFCIVAADRFLGCRIPLLQKGALALAIAVIGNLILFFGRFPLPEQKPAGHFRGLASIVDAIRVGTYESSYARVSLVKRNTELGLQQIAKLQSGTDRPVLVVWTRNGQPVWRLISYYFPSQRIYALDEKGDPAVPASMARLWTGNKVLAEYTGEGPFRITIPKSSRVIWAVGPNRAAQLKRILPFTDAAPLGYTDLPADAHSFRWESFEFVPQ